MIRAFRASLAAGLCVVCSVPPGLAQSTSQQEQAMPVRPTSPIIIRSYKAATIPEINYGNSSRLTSLIRGGKLYLTVQDAIALAIENNIDVQVSRYTPILDSWNLERARAGGALPGVPTGSSQASSVAKGQGVLGSQAAAGVSTGGNSNNGSNTTNATVTQIGPVVQTFDPVFQDSAFFSHFSRPQANLRQSLVANLVQTTHNYTSSIQVGNVWGGQTSLTFNESYVKENAPSDVLNPSYAPSLQATISQNFLQGFGRAVNSRTINIDKENLRIDDLNFKSEVIAVVVNVLNLYYNLVADYDDLRAKQSALEVAQQFYENNKRQVELGTLAQLDITTAEAQVASSQQDLVTSQGTLEQAQVSLKDVLSRIGTADPLLKNTEVIPLDRIDVPENESFPPLRDLVAKAMNNRVDIVAEKMHLNVDKLTALGTENGVLPTLRGQVSASNAGLSGTPQPFPEGPAQASAQASQQYPPGFAPCPPPHTGQICEVPDKYLVGGFGNALGQMFRRNYPSEGGTAILAATVRNRQAQADYAIDQLSMRQDQLKLQKDTNQIAVDVSNQVVALQQARVRYLAAVKNRVLEQQLLDAEQKKFALGSSTPYNVVTQQRDLATAQSSETAALVAYSNARIAFGQTLGTTLDDTHVSLDEAKAGQISRRSQPPAVPPNRP
jgi:outer membrane protein